MAEGNRKVNGILPAVGALFIVISGVFAMVQPMNERIKYLESQVSSMRGTAERSRNKAAEQNQCITTTKARVEELDTRMHAVEEWRIWWNREMLTDQVQMSEKIKQLERNAYGSVSPQISGE